MVINLLFNTTEQKEVKHVIQNERLSDLSIQKDNDVIVKIISISIYIFKCSSKDLCHWLILLIEIGNIWHFEDINTN